MQLFDKCVALTNVTIPVSVTNIGNEAFKACSSIAEIVIPNTVTTIGNNIFTGCSSLKNATVPQSCADRFKEIFADAPVEKVVLDESVKTIGDDSFKDCSSKLKEIVIPNTVTLIEQNAFSGCTSVKTVRIPVSVTKIADGAFFDCTDLETIFILNPESEIAEGNTIQNTAVIYGFKNSTAETYADENSVTFKEIYKLCPDCGEPIIKKTINPPTCTTEGSETIYCDNCPHTETTPLPARHTEVIDPEIPATFESEGLSEGSHCSVCGEVLKPQEVLPKLVYMEQKNEKTGIEVIAQNNVKLDVDEVKPIDALNAAVAEKGEKIEKAYDINLLKDDEAVQPSGTVTVKIPCDNPGGKIYRVESNNSLTNMNAKYENGFLVFEADDLGVYVATSPDIVIGDVDGDGTVNINDATMVQKYVAELVTLTPEQLIAADTNGDGEININDATQIQKFIAELIDHLG